MKGNVEITRHVNFPVESNCFIIKSISSDHCIIVDPAQGNGEKLVEYLLVQNLMPDFIIITHEHFDHISSVDRLRKSFNCKLIASLKSSESITNSKKNLSLFYDQIGFSCFPAEIQIENNGYELQWQNATLHFYLTPGHSEGGLCFGIEGNLFTGDTILNSNVPVVKLPGGDLVKIKESIKMLKSVFSEDTTVYPGHGEIFKLSDSKINISI